MTAKKKPAAEAAEAEAKAAEAAEAEAKAAEAAEAEAKAAELPPYAVRPGKCVTSKRGMLVGGDAICADDLGGDKEALGALVKAGYVVEN